jgi:hypothetical protein
MFGVKRLDGDKDLLVILSVKPLDGGVGSEKEWWVIVKQSIE